MSTSPRVRSSQAGPHEGLARAVRRGCAAPFLAPITDRQRASFARIQAWVGAHSGPVWLDAGCGTGLSTARLASAHPEVLVIGVDKSAHRLERGPRLPGNARRVRGELVSLWRQAAQVGLRFDRQWILYPNPWPKPGQLRRRWHGHPIFRSIIDTGPVELRTNWRVYADEMAIAAEILGARARPVHRAAAVRPLSAFEAKYARSGHELWTLSIEPPSAAWRREGDG